MFVWWNFLPDWLCALTLLFVSFLLHYYIPAYQTIPDPSNNALSSTTMSLSIMVMLAACLPLVVVIAYHVYASAVRSLDDYDSMFNIRRMRRELIKFNDDASLHLAIDLHHMALAVISTLAITAILVESLKPALGFQRPDFYLRCSSIVDNECIGNEREIQDGRRAFPSAHASYLFGTHLIVFQYLYTRLYCNQMVKVAIALSPIFIAMHLALEQYRSYNSYLRDVVGGIALGSLVSLVVFRLYYYPIGHNEVGIKGLIVVSEEGEALQEQVVV